MHDTLQPAPAPVRPPGAPWNVSDLPAYTRLSLATIERMIRAGTLASFKVGRRRLVPDAAVQRLVTGDPARS